MEKKIPGRCPDAVVELVDTQDLESCGLPVRVQVSPASLFVFSSDAPSEFFLFHPFSIFSIRTLKWLPCYNLLK